MISGQVYRAGHREAESIDPARISDLILQEDAFIWLDSGDPDHHDLEVLGEDFGLHPLTLKDIRRRDQRPKVQLYRDYAFVVLRPLTPDGDRELHQTEIHALVGPRFLVTLRYGDAYPMEAIVSRWERQPELLALGGGFAVYVLIDEIVDGYLTLVERLEDRADDLEDTIFDTNDADRDRSVQQQLFVLKRETVHLRRFTMPLRQGLDLLEEQPELAPSPLAPYFRDVMEHAIRVVELADNIRDLLTSLLEVRVAQAANRMNDVMKRLTAWATILLAPTLLAGIWGMNFKHMPELNWRYGYLVAIGSLVVSAAALFAWFKWKKRWL